MMSNTYKIKISRQLLSYKVAMLCYYSDHINVFFCNDIAENDKVLKWHDCLLPCSR